MNWEKGALEDALWRGTRARGLSWLRKRFVWIRVNKEKTAAQHFDAGPTVYKCYTNVLCLLEEGVHNYLT